MISHGDFETRSPIPIDNGLDNYSREADVLCFAWKTATMSAPVLWKPGLPNPEELFDHIASGGLFAGWNVIFEYHIWNMVCVPKHGWPALKIESCVDTMAMAAAMNLPQSLGACAKALGLPEDKQKDKRGKYLIQRLCVPHKPTKTRPGVWVTDPALYQELFDYCLQDVVVEDEIGKKLRPLSEYERGVWLATQRLNLRGIPVDLTEVDNISSIVEEEKDRLNDELEEITQGEVATASKRALLLDWINARRSSPLPDLTQDTVQIAVAEDNPPEVARALQIRAAVCQTSTAKLEALQRITCSDGRIRGMHVYHGASTGRFASRGGFNAQNLPRPPLSDVGIEQALDVLGSMDHSAAYLLFGDQVMDAAVSCVRGVIKAPHGKEFIDADFSSVENRVGVWIAGQQDKVDLFAKGLDEYKTFASEHLYGVPYDEVTKAQRQVSKSAVLGCMFGQGAKGLVEFAKGYGVDLTEEKSKEIVSAYRTSYSKVADLWYECERKMILAVQSPGAVVRAGAFLKFCVKDGFLWMRLPSGRVISWYAPKVEMVTTPWGQEKPAVVVNGINRFSRQWDRQSLIGSSAYQSAVQGTARDLLVNGVLNLEAAGYSPILLVHDEILSEVDDGFGSEEEYMELMCRAPEWATGLPLAAEAWRGRRFRK